MKKSLLVTMGLAAAIFVSLAFTKDDPIYKNLKILPKNITKQQMDSVMHHFSLSLGVRCNFCHMRNDSTKTWDFASDENKHKLVARDMMRMMDKINDKYFDMTSGKKDLDTKLMVTCYTCHHGATDPATIPPIPERPQQRPPTDSTKRN
jgi:cytochrome c553